MAETPRLGDQRQAVVLSRLAKRATDGRDSRSIGDQRQVGAGAMAGRAANGNLEILV